ncbi:apolipoprotein N-acyltransferase [candidate division WOR-1 bacterium RIFOXYA12_FULL_43_27]|uniref:Apolipoprotein N-acyltransferase n=1 Tax=candidate division WOR-1 bacterium RIFOXYC2_FULL_46_14 TaxID=1802587 RepID=A0A1F4U778_UNCSA|nr:MAG: apolipoprotein N-acyltransferase [candidate division WOR-1 bacterium RIFOXYA12_FULL_43_27]OGC20307.1 MAG: apolipoprotein N-acyltransferase [candidate division WOR-1 bacterium RIFOXYB2_FULL_46_45]OGC31956.1 MAG: apolipoprotein N-acyltransferase [candidate division WOR-1 bacterium RIFOXYA2_FULL_46_56]OGC40153.1 MAG: apolipoprotein N-acyltransferase [candidate division WOR-1 bacterium RIFOXYC2_FULL_46_14]
MTILSAILLALSFPKANLFFLSWFCLVPLIANIKKKNAAREGLLFGLVFFGINLFWVTTLSDYAGFWAIAGYVALVLFQAVYFAAAAVLIKPAPAFAIPFIWVAVEWLRTQTPFGISAGNLCYSQVHFLPMIQTAPFITSYGISFLIVLINTLLFSKRFIAAVLVVASLVIYGITELDRPLVQNEKSLSVSIIQANIPQEKKLDPAYALPSFDKYIYLSRQVKNADIIIWPETAVTNYLMDSPLLLDLVRELAIEKKAHLLIGTPYYDKGMIYNSLVAFSPKGAVVGAYNKQHLVPFGEYLPFRKLLYPMLKNSGFFDADFNSDPNPKLIEINGIKIGALICFESTFPNLAKERVAKGADILLTVTNDGWFKDSSALQEHLNMGIMRAVENRKYFIQAANTGISAVIDPYGRILKQSKINETAVLSFELMRP